MKQADQALFSEITLRERSLVATELKTASWPPVIATSQRRQDAMAKLIASSASPGIACQSGCWYCCYYKVEARAEEVLQIADYVSKKFNAQRLQRLKDDVASNAATLRGRSDQDQLKANLKCPLLEEGRCSVYQVRPARCRTFNATDVSGCKQSWQEPDNLTISNTLIPALYLAGEAHLKGFRQAMADTGYDTTVYELNSALHTALADSTARRRFDKRKRAFVGEG